ncbi:MAG: hypothetical protein ABJA82_14505 [Myxococcales bacterium]
MDSSKRRVGRPKAAPRTGPLVLGENRSRAKVEVEMSAAMVRELAEYTAWVELSSSLTTADATGTTVEFALREVFRRDRVWQERRREGAGKRGAVEGAGSGGSAPVTVPTTAAPVTAVRGAGVSPSLPPPPGSSGRSVL